MFELTMVYTCLLALLVGVLIGYMWGHSDSDGINPLSKKEIKERHRVDRELAAKFYKQQEAAGIRTMVNWHLAKENDALLDQIKELKK